MKDKKPREFSSYEEMKKFEADREAYLMHTVYLVDYHRIGQFYKEMLLELVHPKYRARKKLYEGYYGGFWRDENGHICAESVNFLPKDPLPDGQICIIRDDVTIYDVYVAKDDILMKMNTDFLFRSTQNSEPG